MRRSDRDFRQKLLDPISYPVLYELIPPPQKISDKGLKKYFLNINEIIKRTSVNALNIPEIHNESGQTKEKGIKSTLKGDSLTFAQEIRSRGYDISFVINHVVVLDSFKKFQDWIGVAVNKYGIKQIIFVGGESDKIEYPGPSVCKAARWVRDVFNNRRDIDDSLIVGGIIIPTRRHKDQAKDESQRIINKTLSGIDFFTTQVIYEADSVNKLIKDYYYLAKKGNVPLKRIFLSFAPVSKAKDITYLKWLGAEIPPNVEQELIAPHTDTGKKSVELCQNVLNKILDYCNENNYDVPLGINVEHIMKYNIKLSRQLLTSLTKIINLKDNNP